MRHRSAGLLAAVRARLEPGGYYLISTAMHDPGRSDEPGHHHDPTTGISYREVAAGSTTEHGVELDGRWYVPHRRHLSAAALRTELVSAGFRVLALESSDAADVVCCLDRSAQPGRTHPPTARRHRRPRS